MSEFDDITGRLRRLGQHPLDPEVARRHLGAMSEVEAPEPARTRTRLRSRFRPALAGGILAGALLGGTGLAGATGNLGPLQDGFHQVTAVVGVHVPEGRKEAGPTPQPAKAPVAGEQKAPEPQPAAEPPVDTAGQAQGADQQAQLEAIQADLVVKPDLQSVDRFYGTRWAPCTIPAGDPKGTPFVTGTHDDYVAAQPPELQAEAVKSDCGKPLSEVDLAAHLRSKPPGPPSDGEPGGPKGGGPGTPGTPGKDTGPPPAPGSGTPPPGSPDKVPAADPRGSTDAGKGH
jgi:hypothetical protein